MQVTPIIAAREADRHELAIGRVADVVDVPNRLGRLVRHARSSLLPLLYAGSAVAHLPTLSRLWSAPRHGLLGETVAARPEVWTMLRMRFVSARWGVKRRLTAIIAHCRIAESLGRPFALRPHQASTLLRIGDLGPTTRLVLDSPRWLLREGLLALSLMDGADRIFSLSFIFGEEAGERVAYVGGIQGRRADDALERNRDLTRAAAGARPQDFLFDQFRGLCAAAGVTRIRCVAADNRNDQTTFADDGGNAAGAVTFDYDAFWRERGGIACRDGFFDVPVEQMQRDESEVPAKRRAARRKKLVFLGTLREQLADALARPAGFVLDQVEPV